MPPPFGAKIRSTKKRARASPTYARRRRDGEPVAYITGSREVFRAFVARDSGGARASNRNRNLGRIRARFFARSTARAGVGIGRGRRRGLRGDFARDAGDRNDSNRYFGRSAFFGARESAAAGAARAVVARRLVFRLARKSGRNFRLCFVESALFGGGRPAFARGRFKIRAACGVGCGARGDDRDSPHRARCAAFFAPRRAAYLGARNRTSGGMRKRACRRRFAASWSPPRFGGH